MTETYLDWNLGLGDAIICNGLVRELANRHEKLVLPCYTRNLPSVRHMFSDLPNVEIREVKTDAAPEHPNVLSIGIRCPVGAETFDRNFYSNAGVDWDCRYSSFYFRGLYFPLGDTVMPAPAGRYQLVHADPRRGYAIELRKLNQVLPVEAVTESRSPLITDWHLMIRYAAEVHCIDSSFIHLVESVPTTGDLFYHAYARGDWRMSLRKNWIILE